jgi:hypothetical protein
MVGLSRKPFEVPIPKVLCSLQLLILAFTLFNSPPVRNLNLPFKLKHSAT